MTAIDVDIRGFLQEASRLKLMVVGDVMLDCYIRGGVDRISPEAPVPIVNVQEKEFRLGGAANVALNLKSLGADPVMCGLIGTDEPADQLRQLLAKERISQDGLIASDSRKTTLKTRLVSGSQQLLRFDEEDTHETHQRERDQLKEAVQSALPSCHAIVFEDYDKGCLDPELISFIVDLAKEHSKPTIVDPKVRNFFSYKGVTVLKPNLKELRQAASDPIATVDSRGLSRAANILNEQLGFENLIVTLSEKGIFHWSGKGSGTIKAHRRSIADVSGAGDTVVATVALCTALGLSVADTAALANLAGGIVCEHAGVVPLQQEQLIAEFELHYS